MGTHIIYARKSTESEDRQVLSIESQIRELKLLAARQGIAVGEVLTESKSAKAPGRRPVFDAIMRRVARGQISAILCWKVDRLARNHLDAGRVLQALADGLLERIVTIDRSYTRDGTDRLVGLFELGMATKFIDDLRANVSRGNRARRERGWHNHYPPLGYLLDPITKDTVNDPVRFPLVRQLWDLLLTGERRPSRIVRFANEELGLRTRMFKRMGGKPICPSHLYSIFGNVFYMGLLKIRASPEIWIGKHEPMVSRQEFERAQQILGRPNNARPRRHEFALTGTITCGACGGAVTAEEHVKPSGRRYVYYHCSRQKQGVKCREPMLSEKDLEGQILRRLDQLSMPDTVLAWLTDKARRAQAIELARQEQARESLRQAVAGHQREEDNLLDLRLRGLVTDELFISKREMIRERRRGLEERIAASGRGPGEVAESVQKTLEFAAGAQRLFAEGGGVQKRAVLAAVCSNPTLQGRKLAWEFKNPFRTIAQTGSYSNWWTCLEEVRTFILENPDGLAIPDLNALQDRETVPSLVA